MPLISPQVWQSSDASARQFKDAAPFRHAVIDDFFDPAFGQRLLNDFPRFEDRYALNEMGQVGGKAVRMRVCELSDAYRELDAYLQTAEFLNYVSKVTGIPDLLYDPDYVGGGTHENRHGQSLDPHVDFNYHPRTKAHRRLNLIVYLNHEWDDAWGGALELHSDPWNTGANQKRAISPLFNRAVIFETNEISWHGFQEIRLPEDKRYASRKSFAIYLYTTERPAAETAAAHATIYVPDAMPHDWEQGRVLADADIALLKLRFTRLREQLRYLYEREKQDGAQLAVLEHALAETRDAWRLPLQGYAKQLEAPNGIWPDQWVGKEFTASFIPQRAMRALELELWAPDQLADGQELIVDLDGQRWQHRVAPGAGSTLTLKVKRAAGARVELKISAASSFVPANAGSSGDDRPLAWLLREIRLVH